MTYCNLCSAVIYILLKPNLMAECELCRCRVLADAASWGSLLHKSECLKCSPCRMPAPDFQIQAKHRYFRLCFASSCGAVLLGVEHPFPQKHSETTPGVRWQRWVGWEPLITPLHVPACCLPSLTLFYLRQQEKLFILVVSPPHLSFPNLSQGHYRQGSG